MSIYEIIFILTTPIYVISIYKLNRCFLGERLSNKKMKCSPIFYMLYF